jgi:hypothetical protein
MNLIGTIALFTFGVLYLWQDDQKKQVSYNVTLEKTDCAPTRRLRCSFDFVEVSGKKNRKDKRHFNISFYMRADLAEGNADAISRLDKLFMVTREVSTDPFLENTGTAGYKKPVRLRIQGSKYKFIREDGEQTVVDIERRTRP